MPYSKRLPVVVSLLLLAACSLALLATSAQAEVNWRIEGLSISEKAEIEGEKDSGPYGFLIPSLGLSLVFTNFSIDNGVISPGGTGTAELLFTEGKVFNEKTGKEVPSCEPGDLVFHVKTSLLLHEGKTYELVEPASGSTLTITTYNEETCPLPSQVEVTGSFVLEDTGGGFEEEAVKHLVQQASIGLFPTHEMKFGEYAMRLDGSWWMKLKGKHSGENWSGVV